MAKYTPELVETLCENIAKGFTILEACESVGISKQTFFRWVDEKSDFRDQLKEIEKVKLQNIKEVAIGSLLKKVSFYEYDEVTTEVKETSEGVFTTTKTTRKLIIPTDSSLIFSLANIAPDQFKRADKQVEQPENESDKVETVKFEAPKSKPDF